MSADANLALRARRTEGEALVRGEGLEVPPEEFERGCPTRNEDEYHGRHCRHTTGETRFCCMCRRWTDAMPLRWEGDDS